MKKNRMLEVKAGRQEGVVSERSFVVITLNNVNDEYLEETRELFGKFYGRTLTDEECVEIINNMLNAESALRTIKAKN
ncbi:MAG: hypothetical protein IKO48_01945 [Elusimicrobia bacterium]|nr:hypothetical protein [Elusimicrobiota bacterium]